jgi:hypothetical protein
MHNGAHDFIGELLNKLGILHEKSDKDDLSGSTSGEIRKPD